MSQFVGHLNVEKVDKLLRSLRSFFYSENYKESFPQCRQHILAACEDAENLVSYVIGGKKLPMVQSGQMGLEDDILEYPHLDRVFCLTTSYRNEQNPKPRHDLIFPLFEFERFGNYADLLDTMRRLLRHLGYTGPIVEIDYEDACKRYGVTELGHEHEEAMEKDLGPVVFLKYFPIESFPFWNMKLSEDGTKSYKLDVILGGCETIGSAEREVRVETMRNRFYAVSDGKYHQKLFEEFGQDRVEKELNDFLQHDFKSRFGGGIGVSRLIKFLTNMNLL